MTVHTLIVSVEINPGNEPKPVATVVWPAGKIERVTLADHDWSYDWHHNFGNHSTERPPASFYRWFNSQWSHLSPNVHGDRKVYTSPANVGTGTNELGRLNVWEVDYEV